MVRIRSLIAVGSCALLFGSADAQQVKQPPDPNQKICEVVKPVGSRLGGKKICATRAEWADKKRQDREAVEKAQTQLCVANPSGKCGE